MSPVPRLTDLACAPQGRVPAPDPAEAGTALVRVEGWVHDPLHLREAELDAMPGERVADFDVVCTWDGSHGVLPPVRAVWLGELIERAQPAFEERTDFKRVAIVAEGHGGYRALYSWGEVFNSPLGRGIVVAYAAPDTPLPPGKGPFVLFSRHDTQSGPRYVQGLRRIELVRVW